MLQSDAPPHQRHVHILRLVSPVVTRDCEGTTAPLAEGQDATRVAIQVNVRVHVVKTGPVTLPPS